MDHGRPSELSGRRLSDAAGVREYFHAQLLLSQSVVADL